MKKCIWLLVFAMFCWHVDCCFAKDCVEGDFLGCVGNIEPDSDGNYDNEGCYHDDRFCKEEEGIDWDYNGGPDKYNCDKYIYACIFTTAGRNGWVGVPSCETCKPGFELVWEGVGSTVCASPEEFNNYCDSAKLDEMGTEACAGSDKMGAGSGLSASHYACKQNCQDSNCVSDTSWVKVPGSPYESRSARSCSEKGPRGTCIINTEYRCAANYYGSSTDGKTGCNPCPQWTGVYSDENMTVKVVGKSEAGATDITGCIVKKNIYHDSIGTFEIEEDCVGQ